jgi:hypothetical protein
MMRGAAIIVTLRRATAILTSGLRPWLADNHA